MNKEDIQQLAERISRGTASDEDISQYNTWFNHHVADSPWNETELGARALKEKQLFQHIETGIRQQEPAKTRPMVYRVAAAACILLCLSAAGYFFFHRQQPQAPIARVQQDIEPGGNKAWLVLSNGQKISLTDAGKGQVAQETGIAINKTADGQLAYAAAGAAGRADHIPFNTISTPKGGKWELVLPDGSIAWLNAASSLTYPASFAGAKERRVELAGEAYFEITKDKTHPFIVKTTGQEVEVLGTHFNINSYNDEPSVKTTLLEGSVSIRATGSEHAEGQTTILSPGQQAILAQQQLTTIKADEEEAMAWFNGKIIFNDESLVSIMRRVSRWYDIDVVYEPGLPEMVFQGAVSRTKSLSSVLKFLSTTGNVDFSLEGRTITVSKRK